MRPNRATCARSVRIACAVTLLLACGSCRRNSAQLRLYNSGAEPLERVTVLFPDDEVGFGDVPIRSATRYMTVTHGVGSYAAFRFSSRGVPAEQYVADFAGWKALDGMAFTYRVQVERGPGQPFLRILEVVRDR